jgi:cullin 1
VYAEVTVSEDLTSSFNAQNHSDTSIIDFRVMIFGTNIWPLSSLSHQFVIPAPLASLSNRFQLYYKTKHTGRIIRWLWNYSKNELRATYLQKMYTFIVSSYQMGILLLYNAHDNLSLKELEDGTGLPEGILSQIIALFLRAKILLKEEEDQYRLNFGMDLFLICPEIQSLSCFDRIQIKQDPHQPQLTHQI